MIDTHCHLLPGLDDGPRTIVEAIELARDLAETGVRLAVCTPHFSRQYPTPHSAAVDALTWLQSELQRADIRLATELAAEVSPAFAVTEPLPELAARSIAGRFLVVELESDTQFGFLGTLQTRLDEAGLVPVLAHPERCRAVQKHPGILDRAREHGALVQIVCPSLVERWGRRAAAAAWGLLESGRVDLIASDAHGSRRAPDGVDLAEAAELIVRRHGRETYLALAEERPALVVRGAHPDKDRLPGDRHSVEHHV